MPTFRLPKLQSTYSLLTPRNYRKTGTHCLRPGEMGRNPSTKRDSDSTIDRDQNGHIAPSFSLHPLTAGGATALYRATKDIDLAERFGRWETRSISERIWESLQMMDGMIDHMVIRGAYDTQRDEFPGRNEATRPRYPTSRPPQCGGDVAGAGSGDY